MITWMCIRRIATKYNKPQKQKTGDIHFTILCCVDLFKAWVGIWVMFFFGGLHSRLGNRDPRWTTGCLQVFEFPPPFFEVLFLRLLGHGQVTKAGQSKTEMDGTCHRMGKSLRNCRTKCWFCCLPCLIAGTNMISGDLWLRFVWFASKWMVLSSSLNTCIQTHQNWWLNHKWVPKNMRFLLVSSGGLQQKP